MDKSNLEERRKELEQKKKQLEKELEEKIQLMNREEKRREIREADKHERYTCSKCKKKTIMFNGGCMWCREER